MIKKISKTITSINQVKGTIPVLVLAGHAHTHRRPNLMQSYKLAEPWTDYIARNIAEITGAHAIILDAEVDYDPNLHQLENNPFKQVVVDVFKNNEIKYVFDLHGLNDKHQFDVGAFYVNRYYKSKQLCYGIADKLNDGKLNNLLVQVFKFQDDYFNNGKQETLTKFVVEKYKVSGVQLEIARYIREDEILRRAFIKGLSSFIINL